MIQIPANLAQRILDAARIATAIHLEQDAAESPRPAPQPEIRQDLEFSPAD
jgi:hypothetical protein